MNKRVLLSVLLLILGVGIVLATVILEQNSDNSFRTGMFIGFGASFIGISIVNIIKLIQYKKNPEKLKKDEMLSKEERNIMIKDKASSFTVLTYNVTLAIIIMTLAVINVKKEIILIVFFGMMLNIIIFLFMIYYYSKKY